MFSYEISHVEPEARTFADMLQEFEEMQDLDATYLDPEDPWEGFQIKSPRSL